MMTFLQIKKKLYSFNLLVYFIDYGPIREVTRCVEIAKISKGDIDILKALFLSRHIMTSEQSADFQRIFPGCEVTCVDATVESAAEIVDLCSGYDVLAAVLPLHLYAEFFAIKPVGLRVVFSRSKRISTGEIRKSNDNGKLETAYSFVHDGWLEIKYLDCQIECL